MTLTFIIFIVILGALIYLGIRKFMASSSEGFNQSEYAPVIGTIWTAIKEIFIAFLELLKLVFRH